MLDGFTVLIRINQGYFIEVRFQLVQRMAFKFCAVLLISGMNLIARKMPALSRFMRPAAV
jgi:hypothetical protein